MNTNNKSIAYIVPDIYPCASGGMEIYYNKLLIDLKKCKQVLLFTSCSNYNEEGVEIVIIKKRFFGLRGTAKIYTLINACYHILKNKRKIKLIHFPYTGNCGRWGYVLPLLRVFFKVEYFLMIHDGTMSKWKFMGGDRMLFHYASKIIGVSDTIKNEYEKRINKKIEVIYPLVKFSDSKFTKSEIRNRMNIGENDKVIIFIGTLKDLKAPGTLLKAFIDLGFDYILKNRLKLYFIGKGNLREELEREINENKLTDYVVLTGIVSYDLIPDFYKMADIYVIPSNFEGTSKSMLEAMYNYLPIIASDVNGINNVFTDEKNALLFQAGDYQKLGLLLKRVIENETIAKQLAEHANQLYRSKYDYRLMIDQLVEVYN